MIYPDFNELINLQHKAKKIHLLKNKTPNIIIGENSSKNYGSGLEFEEVRKYVFGDDIRNIDWSVTARTGKVHSKLFTIQTEKNVNVIVDMNSNMHFGTKCTFKSVQASRIAALILWCFNKNNDKVGGIVFGNCNNYKIFPPSKSKHSLLKLLSELCLKNINKTYIGLDKILSKVSLINYNNSKLYIISDFINFNYDTILENLTKLYTLGVKIALIQVIDERDYSMPNIGQISFFNHKGDNIVINTSRKKDREQYLKIWQDNQYKIQELTQKINLDFLQIKTSDEVYLKLSSTKRI